MACYYCRTLLCRLDEVGQLLYEFEVGQQVFANSHQGAGVWQAGHKSRPSVGKSFDLSSLQPALIL